MEVVNKRERTGIMLKTKERAEAVLELLPREISEEIRRVAVGRVSGLSGIREIRLRAGGRSTLMYIRERMALFHSLSYEEIGGIVRLISDGSLYSAREGIAEGYITMEGGIRVGIGGRARYDSSVCVGISDISSLVFRIPTGECEFSEELYKIYLSGIGRGLLIYSSPGVGKTTALRSLAASIGSGKERRRVCVVDERCEFSSEDYSSSEVDILRGYKKKAGIEIATRTLAPEVIMVDEIGADEASALSHVLSSGVPMIATAHAASLSELLSKPSLAPLLSAGVFDKFVGISLSEDGYSLAVDQR